MGRILSLGMVLTIVLSFVLVGSGLGSGVASAAGSSKDVWVGSCDGTALVPGTCLRLATYSSVGCDRNGDGYVWFQAIPTSTYTVEYTSVPQGNRIPDPERITIYRSSPSRVTLGFLLERAGAASADVSIVSFDVEIGDLPAVACFSLRGYSNVGCDENGDGQVDVADIPFGTYVIDVERFPAGTALAFAGEPAGILDVTAFSWAHTVTSIIFTYEA